MGISINYKGWEFEFDRFPTSEEIEARYELEVGKSQIVLPVPRPRPLIRATGPHDEQPLAGRRILAAGLESGDDSIVGELVALGATIEEDSAVTGGKDEKHHVLLFDARALSDLEELGQFHEFFGSRLRALERNGRVVIVVRPLSEARSAAQAATWRASDAFVRSLAWELGPSASTANRLVVAEGAEKDSVTALAYLCSDRSAYVTGQTLTVNVPQPRHPNAADSPFSMAGALAIVTGAGGGIGRATARQFASDGATVICVDVPGNKGLETLKDEFGGIPCPLDITTPHAPESMAEYLPDGRPVDLFVHNAGIVRDGMMMTMPRGTWDQVMAVNALAPERLTEHFLAHDLIADFGRLVFVASTVGISGSVGQANYAASKAAVLGLVDNYAPRLSARGITVNAVAPGTTQTGQTAEVKSEFLEAGRRLNALSQMGKPTDAANGIAMLSSPGSQGITGSCLRVCGGALPGA